MSSSTTISAIALIVSTLALLVSAMTAWLTFLRRGTVKMTQPTVIFFGYDEKKSPKIFLRALLHSTSKRGRIIESMYVTLSCEELSVGFDVWVYGHRNELVRGSGVFVNETGVEANHHFLMAQDSRHFAFISGQYRLNVYAHLLGDSRRKLLFSQDLVVPSDFAEVIGEHDAGLYFDWRPERAQYASHVDQRPRSFWESAKV